MRVFKVTYQGSFIITAHLKDALATVENLITDDIEEKKDSKLTMESFEMTEEEYEQLPEFEGF